VDELEAFVAKERGLAFTAPVKVTLLDDAAFRRRLLDDEERDQQEVEEVQRVLAALHLIDRDIDLGKTLDELFGGVTAGFYDSKTKELVVRGARPTPYVKEILVHELTHALEDQHFDLDRSELGDEAFLGFLALAEGSAGRVEDAYRASLPTADRRAADREEQSWAGAVSDVPTVVQLLLGFPYIFGPELVTAIVRAGGQRRLDEAFRDPPASTEQALDPPRYLRGDDPKPVPAPRADGTAFDDGEIGAFFLSLMLGTELDEDEAAGAVEGWGGDHYVAWREGRATCVRMTFVMDTPADTAELTGALAEWAGGRGDTADADGTTLRTCG
ncbi:MAG: hypothetical protein ACRD0S_06790, partial [Acidimicrobiales bacterium]